MLRPSADVTATSTGRSITQADGIYNIRSHPNAGESIDPSGITTPSNDDDPGLRKESDFRTAQVFKGKTLVWLAYQSMGVIYGDIGTSPLYVYSSTFSEPPSKKDLIGVLSLILWSLTIMVTIKYVVIILRADNDGEGGTFSTYALLSRYMHISDRDPREASLIRLRRWNSGDLECAGRGLRRGMESSKIFRAVLKVISVVAVSMVIADGVLTPAQSVLGAVQGIQVVDPTLSKSAIVGITDAILIVLFLTQPLGITKLTILFAPVVLTWLGLNAVFGVYNLVKYDASVFEAFNPGLAFRYLIDHGDSGWRALGGVLLAFTGVEALFADLGAFSRRAVQLSWLCYVMPCLFLAYIGQAAYISVNPEAYNNPFFKTAPPGTIYPALVIAILAAIVASQAIITATFQLLAQVMKMSYFPQLRVIHTSDLFHGQLYIPVANWLLMIGTVIVASVYSNTTRLGNAYGVCVMFVTAFDTIMVSLVAIVCWKLSPWLVALPWLVIACVDWTFLSSVLTKVPHGAWFTLMLAAVFTVVFLIWRYGKEQQWSAESEDCFPTSHLISSSQDGRLHLTDRFRGESLSDMRGLGLFFDKAGETTPLVFTNFVTKLTTLPEVMVFFHLRPLERPSVSFEERYSMSRLAIPNCFRVVVRFGYNDEVITPNLAALIYEQLRMYFTKDAKTNEQLSSMMNAHNSEEKLSMPKVHLCDESAPGTSQELTRLDRAFNHKVLYIIGKEQMKIKAGTNIVRRISLSIFLWLRENTRSKIANLNVPIDRVIEVGFLKEI